MQSKICLNMIVKNESKTLPILFKSIHKIIDYYVITDTGSTDNTIQLIHNEMNKYNIKGKIYEEKWVNFGYNRQKALEYAVKHSKDENYNYILIIDADEELYYQDKNFFKHLDKSNYGIIRKYGDIEYYLPALLNIKNNNQYQWQWKGVVHNYVKSILPSDSDISQKELDITNIDRDQVYIRSYINKGSKTHGLTYNEKYLKDVDILNKELEKDPNDSRSQFYLATSYDNAKMYKEAFKAYQKRIQMNGYKEEIFYSLYRMGGIMINDQEPFSKVLPILLNAYEIVPNRIESIYLLVGYSIINKLYNIGYLLGKSVAYKRNTESMLFIDQNIYDYKMLDAYSICAYWSGDYVESRHACEILLSENKIPEEYKERIKQNLKFSIEKIIEKEMQK